MPLGHSDEHSGVHRIPWDSPGAEQTYIEKVLATASDNLVAYWPLNETSGTVAKDANSATTDRDGTYVGVTLGQTGIGDGEKCPLFDGLTDYVNIYSTSLADAWPANEGTIMIWAKVATSDIWDETSYRKAINVRVDSQNQLDIQKTNAASTLNYYRIAANTADQVTQSPVTSLAWMCLGFTYSVTNNQLIAYYNGSQTGTTQTGIGKWSGAISSTICNIGCYGQINKFWSGWLAHALVANRPLLAAEMLTLATV